MKMKKYACTLMMAAVLVICSFSAEAGEYYPVKTGTYRELKPVLARCQDLKSVLEFLVESSEGTPRFQAFLWLKQSMDTSQDYIVCVRAMLLMEFFHAQEGEFNEKSLSVIRKIVSILNAQVERIREEIEKNAFAEKDGLIVSQYEQIDGFFKDLGSLLDKMDAELEENISSESTVPD